MKKKALDFHATKKLIEKLQQDGVKILRNFDYIFNDKTEFISKQFNVPRYIVDLTALTDRDLGNLIISPSFLGVTNTMYIPRKKQLGKYFGYTNNIDYVKSNNRYPRYIMFHESGHKYSPIRKQIEEQLDLVKNLKDPELTQKELARLRLKEEHSADETAHELLKQFDRSNFIPLYNKLRTKPYYTGFFRYIPGNAQSYINHFMDVIPKKQQTEEDIKLLKAYKKLLGL